MKKWCALCLAAMLCLSPALSCHAASGRADGGADIPVYARYIRDYVGVYDVPVGRGHSPVETDDGVRIIAEGEEGIWLIVYPIPHTDEDARNWLLRCLKDYGTKIYPMEIFFVDENGNRVEPKGEVTITITPPEGFGEAVVCQVAADSEVSRKDSRKNGEEISFSHSGSGYYVLTQKTEETPPGGDVASDDGSSDNGSSQGSSGGGSGSGNSADGAASGQVQQTQNILTGDASQAEIWLFLFCASAGAAAVLLLFFKRRRKDPIDY